MAQMRLAFSHVELSVSASSVQDAKVHNINNVGEHMRIPVTVVNCNGRCKPKFVLGF